MNQLLNKATIATVTFLCVLFFVDASASCHDRQLKGTFGGTLFTDSLNVDDAGFNADGTPVDPSVGYLETVSGTSMFVFDGKGKFTFSEDIAHISFNGVNSFVGSASSTSNGTYKVYSDGRVVLNFGALHANILTGPGAPFTATLTALAGDPGYQGYLSRDGETLLLARSTPGINSVSITSGPFSPATYISAFNGSITAVKINKSKKH